MSVSLPRLPGGILQPQLKKKRTVSTPKPKDFQTKRLGRYCLQHQEEDSDGDIKTALYKVRGVVWPSVAPPPWSLRGIYSYDIES